MPTDKSIQDDEAEYPGGLGSITPAETEYAKKLAKRTRGQAVPQPKPKAPVKKAVGGRIGRGDGCVTKGGTKGQVR